MKQVYLFLKTTLIAATLILITNGPALAKGENMIKTIELSGTYFEIGKKWGTELKTDIEKTLELEIQWMANFFGIEKNELIQLAAKYIPAAKEFDPEFIQVLEGISQGSGLSFEEVFSLRAIFELMFYLQKIPAMCTGFAVTSDMTKDNITIIGQNIDWHVGIPVALLKITWPNGVKQLCLNFGGCVWELPLSFHPSSSPYGLGAFGTVSMTENQDINKAPFSIVMNTAMRQKKLEQALSIFIKGGGRLAPPAISPRISMPNLRICNWASCYSLFD